MPSVARGVGFRDFTVHQTAAKKEGSGEVKKDVKKSTELKIKNIVKKALNPFIKLYNFIYAKNLVTQKRHFWFIPTSFEKITGNWMYASYVFNEGGKTFNEENVELVKQVGKDLTKKTKRDLNWEFTLIRSPKINAFCLPGGKVGIYDGIVEGIEKANIKGFDDITKKDKIAAVLAHEINHADIGHSARRLEKFIILNLIFIGFKIYTTIIVNRQKAKENEKGEKKQIQINNTLDWVANVLIDFCVKLYMFAGSRSQEYEADKYSMHLMKEAGYNPKAALWLQEFLITREYETSDWINKIYEIFSTHPSAKNRLEKNRQTLKEIEAKKS